ncbi:D-hexose-6-phosphate mutarotase [Georgenia faecalis]|uniref:Putative glucose-6-phosphate 1-epimerase n=1 Tax=Georgenia faecalis TaxID=2483799 RepID=A0ABV9DCC0_9MICO|nr:D-hexose-6-phosphate mutarotase [Georgenia faecalis]
MVSTPDLPDRVRLVPGDLDRLVVDAPSATAEIYLQGAHVTAWAPQSQAPVLFTSTASAFQEGRAIRGGIPLCFPWFGPGESRDRSPAHGFARVRPWELVEAVEEGDAVTVVLRLTDDERTRAAWPHAFEATYRVTVGQSLTLALEVRNTGPVPARYDEALHTYLAVSDVASIRVRGLEGVRFTDEAAGTEGTESEPVTFDGALVDRLYPGTDADVVVEDPGHGRWIRTRTERSHSRIVWNPGAEKAEAMADLETREWRHMVCTEVGNVWADAVELAPGETHTLTAEIAVGTLDGEA